MLYFNGFYFIKEKNQMGLQVKDNWNPKTYRTATSNSPTDELENHRKQYWA